MYQKKILKPVIRINQIKKNKYDMMSPFISLISICPLHFIQYHNIQRFCYMPPYVASFILAFQFFTRIPLPMKIEFESKTLQQGTLILPLIGGVIGTILWCFGIAMNTLFPPIVTASLTLTFCVYLTGALHLDGLLDTADGVYSQRTGPDMLRIITDSRIGAFGAIVGILILILKFSLFYALLDAHVFSILIILPMIWSRFMLIVVIVNKPYYSEEAGIGALYEGMNFSHILKTFGLSVLLSLIIGIFSVKFLNISSWYFVAMCGMILMSNLLAMQIIARQLIKQLGGLTGDVYGAINEICEIISLMILVACLIK